MSGVSVSGASAGKEKGGEIKTAVIDEDGLSILKSLLAQVLIMNKYLAEIVGEELKEKDIE